MSTASMVPAVIDYLVARCQASPLLGAATPPVVVVDGPNVTADLLVNQRLLWIGYDHVTASADTGQGDLSWPLLDAGKTDDEAGEVTCSAQFWSGDTTMKPNRDGCAAIVGAVAGLVRGYPPHGDAGDTTMGGLVFWSGISRAAWVQQQKSDGAVAVCVFTVIFEARETG